MRGGEVFLGYNASVCEVMGDRLTVGQRPLEAFILVRFQVPQQNKRSAILRRGLGKGKGRKTGVFRGGRNGKTMGFPELLVPQPA